MSNKWLRITAVDADAPFRLFCFPYAGGSAALYRGWGAALRGTAEVAAVQLPGREGRMGEPPYRRMEPLVDALSAVLTPMLDRPFAFFGYSMGARVAHAVARRWAAEGRPGPERLFVAASSGASLPVPEHVHDRDDADLVSHLRRLGGTPDEYFADAELLRLTLPALRADLAVIETMAPPDGPPLRCPVHALAGEADVEASPRRMAAWARETEGPFTLATVPGGHFFVREHLPEVLAEITRRLVPDPARSAAPARV